MENKDKPIPSPYKDIKSSTEIPEMPQELLDKVKDLASKFGYHDVFLATHGKTMEGKCYWSGASSCKSHCLTHYIGHIAEAMEEEDEDEHGHGEE